MTNMKWVCFALSLFFCSSDFLTAQEYCKRVDSIVVYHLPLDLRTRLSLDEVDVRRSDDKVGGNKFFVDSSQLISFLKTLSDNVLFLNSPSSIDVRVVIDVFVEKKVIDTISMDSFGFFIIGRKKFHRNKKLNEWLEVNIPELKFP